jgi:DNA-binding MarR family transcriptional regulator
MEVHFLNGTSRKSAIKQRRAAPSPVAETGGRSGRQQHAESPADNILALIHVFSNLIGQAFDNRLETEHGLTVHQWRTLLTLAARPGATAVNIVARWALHPMSVSRAVRELQLRGLVVRRVQSSDRRSHALYLTAKGWRVYKTVVPDANARYREIVDCVAPVERAHLARMLVKLVENTKRLA